MEKHRGILFATALCLVSAFTGVALTVGYFRFIASGKTPIIPEWEGKAIIEIYENGGILLNYPDGSKNLLQGKNLRYFTQNFRQQVNGKKADVNRINITTDKRKCMIHLFVLAGLARHVTTHCDP